MSPPDYSTWLTKQQAADAIGVSTKTVEKFAQDQQLQQAAWRAQGRGAERAVYNPDDVARIAAARRPGLPPFVLPAVQTGNGVGNGAIAHAASHAPGEETQRALAAGLSEFAAALRLLTSENPLTSEKSQNPTALFLTIPEAAAVSGLSPTYLRRLIAEGTLKARKDRGWKIRRTDLEAL